MKDGMDKRFVGLEALLMRPKEIVLQQEKAICAGKLHQGTHRIHWFSNHAFQ